MVSTYIYPNDTFGSPLATYYITFSNGDSRAVFILSAIFPPVLQTLITATEV
jgi:hypothetical protein